MRLYKEDDFDRIFVFIFTTFYNYIQVIIFIYFVTSVDKHAEMDDS